MTDPTTDQPCQRWRDGRTSYRPAGEPINPSRYDVELIDEATAKAFIITHHYSRSYPVVVRRVGLFRLRKAAWAELVGVCVFGVPMQPASIRTHAGVDPAEGLELSRFVLLDDVEANGETWFLRRAFRLLRQERPKVRAVIAYSDPVERTSADGRVIKPGHQGGIYKAFNGRLAGRSSPRTLLFAPDGRVVSGRSLSKIRQCEQGAGYAERSLVEMGAPSRMAGESSEAYVARALRDGPFRRYRHPGNLAYAWELRRIGNQPREQEALDFGGGR